MSGTVGAILLFAFGMLCGSKGPDVWAVVAAKLGLPATSPPKPVVQQELTNGGNSSVSLAVHTPAPAVVSCDMSPCVAPVPRAAPPCWQASPVVIIFFALR